MDEERLALERVQAQELEEAPVSLAAAVEKGARELPVEEDHPLSDGARLGQPREAAIERREVDLQNGDVVRGRANEGLLEGQEPRDRELLGLQPLDVDPQVVPEADPLAEREHDPRVVEVGLLRPPDQLRERRLAQLGSPERFDELVERPPDVGLREDVALPCEEAAEEGVEDVPALAREGAQLLAHAAPSSASTAAGGSPKP